MRVSLTSRKKLPFINGQITMPLDKNSREYNIWEIVNRLVLAWILNSCSPHIQSTLMHTQNAYKAWMDLESRYKQSNAPKVNQIKFELRSL